MSTPSCEVFVKVIRGVCHYDSLATIVPNQNDDKVRGVVSPPKPTTPSNAPESFLMHFEGC
jgi:hypothetical protein